jgi:hypothetical protein
MKVKSNWFKNERKYRACQLKYKNSLNSHMMPKYLVENVVMFLTRSERENCLFL